MPNLGIQVGLELPFSLRLFDMDGNRILTTAEQGRYAKEAKEKALSQVETERQAKEKLQQELAALKAQLQSNPQKTKINPLK